MQISGKRKGKKKAKEKSWGVNFNRDMHIFNDLANSLLKELHSAVPSFHTWAREVNYNCRVV